MTAPDRAWLTARLTGLAVSASLESLTLAVALFESLPPKDISPAALMAAQRAREGVFSPGDRVVTADVLTGSAAYLPCHGPRLRNQRGTIERRRESPVPRYDVKHDVTGDVVPYDADELLPAMREVDPDAAMLGRALALVVREVESARLKHGRGFPGGWGPSGRAEDREARQRAQDACDAANSSGGAAFRHVAEEEIAEVFAEVPGTAEHAREICQVAAVYVRGLLVAMAPDLTGERDPRPSAEIVRDAVLSRLEVQGG